MANGEIFSNEEPIFKVIRFKGTGYDDLSSGSGKNYSASDVGYYVPDGYEQVGFKAFSSGGMHVTMCEFYPEVGESRFMCVRNTYSSARSGTPFVDVTFINKKYKEFGMRRTLTIMTDPDTIEVDCPDTSYFLPGEEVTVTINNPNSNWQYAWIISGLSVSYVNGTTYTFTMPDNDVSINIHGGVPKTITKTVSPEGYAAVSITPNSSNGYVEGTPLKIDVIVSSLHYTNNTRVEATLNGNPVELVEQINNLFRFYIIMPSSDSIFAASVIS